jgi:hypothetical protein
LIEAEGEGLSRCAPRLQQPRKLPLYRCRVCWWEDLKRNGFPATLFIFILHLGEQNSSQLNLFLEQAVQSPATAREQGKGCARCAPPEVYMAGEVH